MDRYRDRLIQQELLEASEDKEGHTDTKLAVETPVSDLVTGEYDIPIPEEAPVLYLCPRCKNDHILPKLHEAVGPNKKRWSVHCGDKRCGVHLKYRFETPEEATYWWNAIKRR